MPDIIRLTCVRHGQTYHNSKGIVQGWIGSELTELGYEQARKFSNSINQTPQAIFYSDLNRCKQTVSEIVSRFPDVPVFSDWRLRERSFGSLEGTSSSDINWDLLEKTDSDKSFFGTEPKDLFEERVKSFMRDIAFLGISNAIVVTHGGVLNQFEYILDHNHTRVSHANTDSFDIEYSLNNPNLIASHVPEWSINA